MLVCTATSTEQQKHNTKEHATQLQHLLNSAKTLVATRRAKSAGWLARTIPRAVNRAHPTAPATTGPREGRRVSITVRTNTSKIIIFFLSFSSLHFTSIFTVRHRQTSHHYLLSAGKFLRFYLSTVGQVFSSHNGPKAKCPQAGRCCRSGSIADGRRLAPSGITNSRRDRSIKTPFCLSTHSSLAHCFLAAISNAISLTLRTRRETSSL